MRAQQNSFQDPTSLRPTSMRRTPVRPNPMQLALTDPAARQSALPDPASTPTPRPQASHAVSSWRRRRKISPAICARVIAALALLLAAAPVDAGTAARPANAVLYIGRPADGAVLPAGRPFRVWFGLRNMGVAPKGVALPNTGHHHLLIDTALPPMDQEIPSDRNHLHFGAGETETTVELPPGRHTLQLLMGDDHHVPHDPPLVSKKVTVTVR